MNKALAPHEIVDLTRLLVRTGKQTHQALFQLLTAYPQSVDEEIYLDLKKHIERPVDYTTSELENSHFSASLVTRFEDAALKTFFAGHAWTSLTGYFPQDTFAESRFLVRAEESVLSTKDGRAPFLELLKNSLGEFYSGSDVLLDFVDFVEPEVRMEQNMRLLTALAIPKILEGMGAAKALSDVIESHQGRYRLLSYYANELRHLASRDEDLRTAIQAADLPEKIKGWFQKIGRGHPRDWLDYLGARVPFREGNHWEFLAEVTTAKVPIVVQSSSALAKDALTKSLARAPAQVYGQSQVVIKAHEFDGEVIISEILEHAPYQTSVLYTLGDRLALVPRDQPTFSEGDMYQRYFSPLRDPYDFE